MEPKEHHRHVWTREEDDRLSAAVMFYGEHDWADIGRCLGIDRYCCRVHWLEALGKVNRSNRWTDDEERHLLWLVEEKKSETIPWTFIARALDSGRTAKQCQYKYSALMKKKEEVPVKDLLKPLLPDVRKEDSVQVREWELDSLSGIWSEDDL
jgi:DNA-directed RNA polymerase subunit N (RpoN/RPB10)